ncbi:hypothetical protein DL93DRAFT_2064234 [Clavulina sp. PMI_390]|nr:hypothetical protein DL93DRAFT_2064234 [Clavulina sp. PMI_390]
MNSSASTVVETLPPLILDLFLPLEYPLSAPPSFQSVYFTHSWLPPTSIERLVMHFHELWLEHRDLGEGVLWRIAELIIHGDFLSNPLELTSTAMTTTPPTLAIQLTHPKPALLQHYLSTHNSEAADASFASTTFPCQICLESHKGAACVRLAACGHVFCKACLSEAWGLAVHEGHLGSVKCPDEACMKASAARHGGESQTEVVLDKGEADEADVRRVLTEEQVARWKFLRVQRELARDSTIVYCPLQFCLAPVRAPTKATGESREPGWERLRTCEACGYSFCTQCEKAWHGSLTACEIRPQPVLGYIPGEWSEKRKLRMLKRRRKQLEETNKWLNKSTTRCPGCSALAERISGCNHMICPQCGAHFCFRCGEKVPAADPYRHWREPGASRNGDCYQKLFPIEQLRG